MHHLDQGSQYLAIRCTEGLAEAGLEASVGSRGEAHDNALAEIVIGLFEVESMYMQGPWRGLDQVEAATFD